MTAEGTQELGRRGALEAKDFLWRMLGERINLPFNAYDHTDKLTFDSGVSLGVPRFCFDLKGHLTRADARRFGGTHTAEVFVEAKNYENGNNLLDEFAAFLQRAAVVSSMPAHRDSWFLFVSSVPFGTSKGVQLCNGAYLKECSNAWPEPLRLGASELGTRVVVIIATQSFRRLLSYWGQNG